jgi:glutamate-1-semialdehyde 2,1-aminomutase
MAAGIAMLKLIRDTPDFYSELERKAVNLENGIRKNMELTGVKGIINRVGSMMTFFFTDEKQITSFDEAMKSDADKYAKYFKMSLESGIYLAPSQYECLFISYAHSNKDIETIIAANLEALKNI